MTYGFAPPQSNPYPLTSTDPPQQQYSNPVKPSPQPYSQPQHPVTHQPFTPSSQGPVNQTVVIIGGCPSCRVS